MTHAAGPDLMALHHTVNFVYIQYLRGIAAILVVYFHTKVYMPSFQWSLSRAIGYSGVDIFFAISGFIMIVTNHHRVDTIKDFLIKRALRIYPIYWIATLMGLLVFFLVPSHMSKESIDFIYILSSLTLIPMENASGTNGGVPFLKIAWTLVFEVFFYVIFALTLIFRYERIRIYALVLAMTAFVSFGQLSNPTSATLRFYTNPLILEFIFGCIAGYIVMNKCPNLSHKVFIALIFVCVTCLALGGGRGDGFARIFWFGCPAAVIVFLCASTELVHGARFRSKILRQIGDASYSIYLFHPFCLVGFRIIADKIQLNVASPFIGGTTIVMSILTAIGVGVLAHLWLERPCLLMSKRFLRWMAMYHEGRNAGRPRGVTS